MDGVTVLHSFTNYWPLVISILFWILSLAAVVGSIYLWCIAATRKTRTHLIVSIVLTVLAIVCLLGSMFNSAQPSTYYKVIIDPSVSYLDFIDTYEVIEIEGQIFTVILINEDSSSEDGATTPSKDTIPEWTETPTEDVIPTETWNPSAVG